MRFLKALVIVMGVLIVVATTVLVVLVARRIGGAGGSGPAAASVLLEEPAGTRIVGIAAVGDRLAVHEKGRLDQLVTDLRRALKERADIARIRTLTDDLRQAAAVLEAASARPSDKKGPGGDDVVDADFREVA